MALFCPNKKLKAYKDLAEVVGEKRANFLWVAYDGFVPQSYYTPEVEEEIIEEYEEEEFVEEKPKVKVFKQAPSLQSFARKWNIKENGFSAMNINFDPRMRREAEALGYGVKNSSRGGYFITRNGRFFNPWKAGFKSKESNVKETLDAEIEKELIRFLNTHGISLKYVESLKERGFDAVAIADITNKVIMISKGEMGADTLPEEVAHFAVELLGEDNPLVKRLMDIIDGTSIYSKTYQEYQADPFYQKDGKPDVEKIKKEAIGKAIGQAIISKKSTGLNNSVLRTLNKLWDKVLSFFKKVDQKSLNEEINTIIEDIAGGITSNTLKGDISNLDKSKESILLSKSTQAKANREVKRAQQAIKTLETRIKQLSRKADKSSVKGIMNTINIIKGSIDGNQALIGISTYLDAVTEGAVGIDDKIRTYQESSQSFVGNVGELKDIHDFVTLHSSMINSIYEMFSEDPYIKERGQALFEQTEEVNKIINRANAFVNANMREATKDTIYKHAENPELAETIFEKGEKDISGMSTYINSAKNSKNEVVRIIDSILRNIKYAVNRYVLDKGKDIIKAQLAVEKTGFKDFNKLAERDSEGNLTGNLVREYNYGEWQKAKEKVKAEISKIFNKPFSDIASGSLSGDSARVYADIWAQFHKEHSQTVDGKRIPSKKYINPVYKQLMSNKAVKEYYDLLVKTKKDNLNKLPSIYQTDNNIYKMPQIRKNTLQRIRSEEGNLWKNFSNTIKEDITEAFKVREDETEFGNNKGEIVINPITGEEIKFLPIHFNNKLADMKDLTLDFSASYIAYTHMAETYKQRSAKQGEIWLIEEAINNKVMVGSRAANKGASNLKTALANLVDTHFYGKTKHMETVKYKGLVSGKQREVNVTKIVDRFLTYVRNNNLAFSPFTHLSNYIMGAAYSKIEDIAGRYSTNASKLRAEVEFDKNILHITSELGKRLKTNKLTLMLELNSIIHDGASMFNNLDVKNGVGRMMVNSGLLSTYELTDTRVKGKMLISIYDNHRLFEGKYITFKEFKVLHKGLSNKEINSKWAQLKDKTLYDAYEAKDGKLQIKPEFENYVSEDLLNKINGTLEHVLNNIDGQLSSSDKTELHRYVVGRAILTHRNWMITGLEDRFKSSKYSYVTQEHEEGFYRTFGRLFLSGFKKDEAGNFDKEHLINTMKSLVLASKDMDENDKSNIRKVWSDVMFVGLAMVVAAVLNGIADDEPDDYLAQFGGYLSTRVKMEAIALSPITVHAPFQFLDIIKSPAAGINQFESFMDGLYMLTMEGTAFDEVRSGGYKGMTKIEQLMIKRSIVKPFYETFNIEAVKGKNRYIKQMGL